MNINKKKYNIYERISLLRVVDITLILLGLNISFTYLDFTYFNFNKQYIFYWAVLLTIYYLIIGEVFQLYNPKILNNRYDIFRSIILTSYFTTITYVITPFLTPDLPSNRLQIIYFFLILSIPVFLWRFLYLWMFFSPEKFKNIIFVGKSDKISAILKAINKNNIHNLKAYLSDKEINDVKGFSSIEEVKLSTLANNHNNYEIVVCTGGFPLSIVNSIDKDLLFFFEKGIEIKSFENFYEEIYQRVPKEYLNENFYKFISLNQNNSNRFYLFILRTLDLVSSLFGLSVMLLVTPIVFICNLFFNKGPLFYTQKRMGMSGELFTIYKFRTMVPNAENGTAIWASKNDVRITYFGKFLRDTRIDELPQFFNIIKGDMSIIGPRPERPEFVKELAKEIPFYTIRNIIRPGLTGWAQVNYPYANSVEEQEIKLRYDLYYIKERTTFLDFKILIKTFTTVLLKKGQ
ncbi:exopolysaccharide biosynthesis polyprenyl glycosylphosphotransferase [uncultured Polaribacter sp.]|uniref:exopolysaccharide biosynthesis polyprenyl glycosylphosphotransferase n=1 Tax=uncultured Polaribacter sp. TaxID=174711 RepID=UPI0026114156|nr:exopolysaccharide biosynthesis polyprenyl glycosylphosphotransferase [uncultured Polaribacter sp.]